MQETQVWSQGEEDPLEKEMTTHSSNRAWSMGSQRVGQDWSNLECLHHSPSKFVSSLPDLPPELHEISLLFQTSFSTFSSGHCFHSRFLLNMVLHFQQSITEAEISLPYLTPKVEQKKLQEFWLRCYSILFTCYSNLLSATSSPLWLIFTSLKYVWKYRKKRPGN